MKRKLALGLMLTTILLMNTVGIFANESVELENRNVFSIIQPRFTLMANPTSQLAISSTQSYDRSFTTSISGNYDIEKAVIGAELGVTIGETKSYSTGFSIPVSAGETKIIKYRPKYYPYFVESEYLKVSNSTGSLL